MLPSIYIDCGATNMIIFVYDLGASPGNLSLCIRRTAISGARDFCGAWPVSGPGG